MDKEAWDVIHSLFYVFVYVFLVYNKFFRENSRNTNFEKLVSDL